MKKTPDFEVVREALSLARRAPSVWNRQPWQWRFDGENLHLYSDRERMSGVRDPDGRLAMVSCGIALHHCIVALRGLGWATEVVRFPKPADETLLATLVIRPSLVTSAVDLSMFFALDKRRTENRPLAAPGAAAQHLRQLPHEAVHNGTTLTYLDDAGARVIAPSARLPIRTERLSPWGLDPDHSAVAVISTQSDTPADQLAAGETLSAVLLLATAHELATSPVVDIPERDVVRDEATRCGNRAQYPQAIVRIGLRRFPIPPRTHRRTTHDVLQAR
ncbi:hypothetical protein IEU95_06840 [Hoyosella rhizosphaerae]|uniref:NAD(P)H nitroreductase n=1 Tax=Hoyosella rhizosphaerae TaxID=1755582 RepID=A0A916U3N8_9ACTN|nr:hypothetical protein [Hoyosella rhizosphaerae]MBN4926539.1 hypothetical protein [Hoyosella rhizosphaerae]GGC58469.1 NAD(P)H nitroreductase [Hoyosella rhizosphaerae]